MLIEVSSLRQQPIQPIGEGLPISLSEFCRTTTDHAAIAQLTLDGLDQLRRRCTQGLVGHQESGPGTLGSAEQDLLDNPGTSVGVDPDPHDVLL